MTKRIRGVMVDLAQLRKSPLNSSTFGDASSVLIKEIPFLNTFDLRVNPTSASAKKVEQVLELSLPQEVGASINTSLSALALGPDWWLLIDPELEKISQIEQQTSGEFISLVEVSAQRTCIEISGPNAKAVLQHAWEQDLDDQSFKVGDCAQGLMARCPTIIHRVDNTNYRLYVRSSFAEHLYKFLTDAATEYLK
jgi:sarcosine oxidase subunit gamma